MNAPRPSSRPRNRNRLVRIVIGLLLVYGVIVLIMWLRENRLVYRAESAAEFWEPPPDPAIEDVWLTLDDGRRVHAWHFAPPGAEGAVLMCHGNGGNLSYYGSRLPRFGEGLGRSVLIVDYPGYGRSDGRPDEPGCYAAAEAAYRWLREGRGVPAGRIVLFGESLGAGVTVELASRLDHEALVLVKPFTSLPAVAKRVYPWLPTHWAMTNRFDNMSKIGACRRPVLIAGATADSIVPFAHSEALFAAANAPKEFLRLEGHDHDDELPDDFVPRLRRFLEED